MLKKTISYTDYDGNQRTEDFYFNLSMAELTEMQMGVEGGMRGYIQRIMAANDQTALMLSLKHISAREPEKPVRRVHERGDTIRI